MKKLLFAFIILPIASFGQFSLRPSIGGGYGIVSQKGSLDKKDISGIFIQNATLSAVYWINNWYVTAGAGYLTTGYSHDLGTITLGGFYEPPTYLTNAKLIHKYQHFIIPITTGRKIAFGKLDLLPEAGLDVAFNLSEKRRTRTDQNPDADFQNNNRFSTEFRRLSTFAHLNLTLNYRLTNKLSVFCGPSYKYMIGSIVRQKTNGLTGAAISQNHRAIFLNAGVYINFADRNALAN